MNVNLASHSDWQGRFPRNEIISLLDINRRFNLAESTAQDLTFEQVMALAGGAAAINDIKLGYGSSAGLPRLRNAVASLTGVDATEIITTQGTALGLFLLAFELCKPGDEAVIVTPCFPLSRDTLVATGVTLRECNLSFDQSFKLTADILVPLLNERTKLVSMASPQNPNGVRTSLAETKAILELIRKKAPNARLFVDETYRDAAYGEESVPPSSARLGDEIITGGSVSKAHGAPGLRVGWLTVREPELRERLTVAKMNIVLSGSPLNETLAAAILENREKILSDRRKLLANGLSLVTQWIDTQKDFIDWVKPEGGALCCLRLKPSVFDQAGVERFWAALPSVELQIGDGAWFGETSRCLRLGFGYLPLEVLPDALKALSTAIIRAKS
jgi:aspartate/methionine/tyrosine aminotransferase